MSINVAKWTLFLSLCASRITSVLLLTFSSFHAAIVSSFSIPCPLQLFASGFFIACGNRNEFVNQIVMGHRSKSFARNVIFVFCR